MLLLRTLCAVCGALFLAAGSVAGTNNLLNTSKLTLDQAIQQATTNDPWIIASQQKESATVARSEAAQFLPDPKLNFGLMNLPTDTFDYEQEPMTQVAIGMSQMLPRGDSLELKSQRLRQQSQLMPLQREQRKALVRLTVTQLWLDALKASHSIKLIEDNRILFEQLTDIVSSSYSSAFGKTRQQDLVRARLELDQLDDRLVQLRQQKISAKQKLAEWLEPYASLEFDQNLTVVTVTQPYSDQQLIRQLARHPSIRNFDQSIVVANTEVDLAEQKYKPQWVINASYGFRGDDSMGNDRPDLFSVGVSIDMPIFSSKRQDAGVRAETREAEAIRTERLLAIRNLRARYQTLNAEMSQLDQRMTLYSQRLLPGLDESAEAAINAYTADNGSFFEVVQARINELNAKLAVLAIKVERSKKMAEIDYLLTGSATGANL